MPLVEPRLERLPYYVALRLVDRPQERSSPDRPIRQRTDQILDAIEWKLDRSRGDRHLDEAGGAKQLWNMSSSAYWKNDGPGGISLGGGTWASAIAPSSAAKNGDRSEA
jgi:hypothetical protein